MELGIIGRVPAALLVAVLSLTLNVPPSASAAPPPCPPESTTEVHRIVGWLHPCGTALADARGRTVRPIPVSLWEMSHDSGRDPELCRHWTMPPRGSYARFQRWGFNSVLLYISWANIEPTRPTSRRGHLIHHYDEGYLAGLDRVVQRFGDRGVKVILDMANNRWSSAFTDMTLPNGIHVDCGSGMPPWLYRHGGGIEEMVQAEKSFFNNGSRSRRLQFWLARAWGAVASRYRGDRSVIGAVILHEAYDLLAQPYPGAEGLRPDDLHLARFYERIGRAIQATNRRLLLFTPDRLDWHTNRFALTRTPQLANGVYTFEFFAPNWKRSGQPRMEAYWARATAWDQPAWVEEFFAFLPTSAGEPNPRWAENAAAFEGYARDHHIGWSYAPYSRLPDHPPGLLEVLQGGF
jgi:cellulase (glycosyl hydrolase family 5)